MYVTCSHIQVLIGQQAYFKSNTSLFVTCAEYSRCRPYSEMLTYRLEPIVQKKVLGEQWVG
jgi:hypothetical protein